MNYSLKFNSVGQLDGWQDTKYEINECPIIESQKFYNDVHQGECSFLMVFQNNRSYCFEAASWGTIEIARDAAELFAFGGWLNCIEEPEANGGTITYVMPNREEAFVNA